MSGAQRRAEAAVAFVVTPRRRLAAWLLRHAQVLVSTLGHLARQPLGSLLTVAVIGIALALPLGLYVLLENVQSVSRGWDGAGQISLFLKMEIDDEQARRMAAEVLARPDVVDVRVISHGEALDEYRRLSGFGEVLEAFRNENPLPAVIVVQPHAGHLAPAEVERLVDQLGRRAEVDLAQFDLQWVRRLHAITDIVQRAVVILAALLALGVLLVVGNTIRLGIENRRDEIEIAKLFGGTDAFIRRPFLYGGFWYGLLGAVFAWVLTAVSLELLRRPLAELAALYESDFLPVTLDPGATLVLLACGAGLGLTGSWLAVGRHLHAIEPT